MVEQMMNLHLKTITFPAIIKRIVLATTFATFFASANSNPTIDYIVNGSAVTPWELALNYGQEKLDDNGEAKTTRGSLVLRPETNEERGEVVRLIWKPKGIKNEWGTIDKNILTATITNTMQMVDLSSVVSNAALTFDIKVNKAPKELVELTLESEWDWQQRASFPLKSVLKKIPAKEWVTLPIPLTCFSGGTLNFAKITSIMQLTTTGKMDVEISNIRLTATSESSSCG